MDSSSSTGLHDVGNPFGPYGSASYGLRNAQGVENLVNPNQGGKHQASNTYADITRAEWADYQKTFRPWEQELAASIGNEEMLSEQLGKTDIAVNDSFDQAAGTMDRNNTRRGVSLNPEEQAVVDRTSSMGRASTLADAKNNVRIHSQDRDNQLLTSGLGSGHRGADS